jgi:regulator of protease activity HflC (stomatin/prohibitin superfamily)
MFDRLVDIVLQFLDKFAFLVIVSEFERVVILRFGRYSRTLEPGLHLMWPLAESAFTDNVVPRTYDLNAQSLTTSDGRSVVVSGVVTARISDIRKAILEVEGMDDAIKDASVAEIAAAVVGATWAELTKPEFGETLTAACRRRAFRWGVEIMRVQLSDVAASRSLRLFHDYGKVKT